MAHLRRKMNTLQSSFQNWWVFVVIVEVEMMMLVVDVAGVVLVVEVYFWQVLEVELFDSFVEEVVGVDVVSI